MNNLTKRLLSEGYTPENPPAGVAWDKGWQEFEYTIEAARQMVWETPCGLLRQGRSLDACGNGSFLGITYSIENENLRIGCPIEKECVHRDTRSPSGWNCTSHRTNRTYDYECSVEKLWDEKNAVIQKKKDEFYNRLRWGNQGHRQDRLVLQHCECIRYNEKKKKWQARYDPFCCAAWCTNRNICILTGKPLDGKKGNVFYDLKITKTTKSGLWSGEEIISITKGKKAFDAPRPLVICEAYAKSCKANILKREKDRFHRDIFFDPGLKLEILNIRVKYRESRDLLQDLRDIQEGIAVVHASDLQKKKVEAKKKAKIKRRETKERKIIKNLKRMAGSDNKNLKDFAKKELVKKGIALYTQGQLFQETGKEGGMLYFIRNC